MAELRAGGLAIIIKSEFPENIGKVVTTIKQVPRVFVMFSLEKTLLINAWETTRDGDLMTTDGIKSNGEPAYCLPENLMPIDGDNFPMEVFDEEKEHVS